MSILLDRSNRVLIQGATGQMGTFFVEDARKYGTRSSPASHPAETAPLVGGDVPVFASVRRRARRRLLTARSYSCRRPQCWARLIEAIEAGCRLVVATADELPVLDTIEMRAAARANGTAFVGPQFAGHHFSRKAKLGFMPSFCYKEGNVGVISRSGSLSYEGSKRLTARRDRPVDGDRHRRRSGQRHDRGGSSGAFSSRSRDECRVVSRRNRRIRGSVRRGICIARGCEAGRGTDRRPDRAARERKWDTLPH